MTRLQKITKLQSAYRSRRLNHKSTATVWEKLRDCTTRQLIAELRALRRARRAQV